MQQDPQAEQHASGPPPRRSWVQPSSSRMLATYLADVEQMLDEQRWDSALRDAVDLPQIAVALSDPGMRCSTERCRAWCAEWIRATELETDAADDPERINRVLSLHLTPGDVAAAEPEAVPSLALRRLRLRRHARIPPRGFSVDFQPVEDADDAEVREICTALVEAMRRWYAHAGCHDATAQVNLAKLAVLR